MKKNDLNNLIDLYVKIRDCDECGLPEKCRPQLRPPGPEYKKGGVVFVQINPGYIGVMNDKEVQMKYKSESNRNVAREKMKHTKEFLKVQKEFFKSPSLENFKLLVDHFHASRNFWGWPPGKFRKTIEGHGVDLKDVAIINLAQCPVENNQYRKIIVTCYNKWFREMISQLRPATIVSQGKVVKKILEKVDLPDGIRLVEGIHHGSRRSDLEKKDVMNRARKIINETR